MDIISLKRQKKNWQVVIDKLPGMTGLGSIQMDELIFNLTNWMRWENSLPVIFYVNKEDFTIFLNDVKTKQMPSLKVKRLVGIEIYKINYYRNKDRKLKLKVA